MAADPLVLGPFVGTTPCADCPGIATELTLTRKDPYTAEGSYRLRMTYLERGPPLESAGDWTTLRGTPQDPDATVYELNPDEPGQEQYWLKVGDDRVTMLDRDLNPIQSDLNFTLDLAACRLGQPGFGQLRAKKAACRGSSRTRTAGTACVISRTAARATSGSSCARAFAAAEGVVQAPARSGPASVAAAAATPCSTSRTCTVGTPKLTPLSLNAVLIMP